MPGGHSMSKLPEPDDLELFVGGVEPDASVLVETARMIEEYKSRPDYPFEAKEAERVLAALGINARHGLQDARSLLEHWHRCVAELSKADVGGTNGEGVDKEDVGVRSGIPREK